MSELPSADSWIAQFAGELGTEPPNEQEFGNLLKLAGIAAHSSERIAAPIACYLAGRTGKPIDDLIALAEELSVD